MVDSNWVEHEQTIQLTGEFSWENGLKSIWSGLADRTKIAETAKSYIAFTKGTSDLLIFYVVYPPTATTISTIKYDLNITNGAVGSRIGPMSWWKYEQFGNAFTVERSY